MKKTKGRFITDTFEKLEDLGKSTAKNVAQETIKTFSPMNILEDLTTSSQTEKPKEKKESEKKNPNHSPINMESLKQEYDKQDKKKEVNLKNRLFQLVKQGEENELQKKKQKEKEDEQIELEEQKKKEQEKKKQEQQKGEVPQGKVRRSIFSPKIKAKREHFEVRPSQGKQ
jgi:hypothetical protein